MKTPMKLLTLTMLLTGCSSESQRVADIAEQAMHQQSRQNDEMARLNREIAAATERLVEADAKGRQEILTAHQSLVAQRDALEQERRKMASQRVTQSYLAPILWHLGMLMLCLLPIALAILVLRTHEPDDLNAVNEILVHELVSEQPRLLPPPPAVKRLTAVDDISPSDAAS